MPDLLLLDSAIIMSSKLILAPFTATAYNANYAEIKDESNVIR
jgi:hypothetical protein